MKSAVALAVFALGLAHPAAARQTPPPVPAPAPETAAFPAAPADVASADAIIAALYDVISGEAGTPRDWARFRSLFVPGALMGGVGRGPDGAHRLRPIAPADYISRNSARLAAEPFYEREIGRQRQGFGPIVTVLSAFAITTAPDAATPLQRGVNTIQLLNDGHRWWIISIVWSGESAENPIPAGLLTGP